MSFQASQKTGMSFWNSGGVPSWMLVDAEALGAGWLREKTKRLVPKPTRNAPLTRINETSAIATSRTIALIIIPQLSVACTCPQHTTLLAIIQKFNRSVELRVESFRGVLRRKRYLNVRGQTDPVNFFAVRSLPFRGRDVQDGFV